MDFSAGVTVVGSIACFTVKMPSKGLCLLVSIPCVLNILWCGVDTLLIVLSEVLYSRRSLIGFGNSLDFH